MKDLTGQKFGRLTVIQQEGRSKSNRALWLCKCECGGEKIVNGAYLQNGGTRSCGCLFLETRPKKGWGKSAPRGQTNFKITYGQYKRRAKRKNLVFELSEDEFKSLNESNCYYCGRAPSNICNYPGTNGAHIYNGIDRVDNEGGYTVDNVVPCCGTCNYAKKETTVDEVL